MDIKQQLDAFIAEIPVDSLVQDIVSQSSAGADEVMTMLTTFINETHVALDLVQTYLKPDIDILEVGAGLGFFSLFLCRQGYRITALEPAIGGFDLFSVAKRVIASHYRQIPLVMMDKKAEELGGTERFDLIFSSNVMEHIPNLKLTLQVLAAALKQNGLMVHACPNYVIPYDPHFGIPVLGFWPAMSGFLFKKRIGKMQDVWDSLNFIGYFDVKRFARHHALPLTFRKGLLYQAFMRLESDEYFRQRQSGLVIGGLYRWLKFTGLLNMLKYLPAFLSTPMIFEIKAKQSEG